MAERTRMNENKRKSLFVVRKGNSSNMKIIGDDVE